MPQPEVQCSLSSQSSGSPGGDAGRCASLAAFRMSEGRRFGLSVGPHLFLAQIEVEIYTFTRKLTFNL